MEQKKTDIKKKRKLTLSQQINGYAKRFSTNPAYYLASTKLREESDELITKLSKGQLFFQISEGHDYIVSSVYGDRTNLLMSVAKELDNVAQGDISKSNKTLWIISEIGDKVIPVTRQQIGTFRGIAVFRSKAGAYFARMIWNKYKQLYHEVEKELEQENKGSN